MEDEFLCARCARHMKTCCETSEVYVTLGDVARIAASTGRADFHEFCQAEDPVYLQDDGDTIWQTRVFRPDGTRRILRREPNGRCTFLGPQGCTLSDGVRPLLCRIYPFDFTEQGLLPELCTFCPSELLPPGVGLVQALGMQREVAEALHRQLYQEILQEPVCQEIETEQAAGS